MAEKSSLKQLQETPLIRRHCPKVNRASGYSQWLAWPANFTILEITSRDQSSELSSGEVLALRAHCVHTAHTEVGILTQIIRLVVTILFPRNPLQKNEPSKNI